MFNRKLALEEETSVFILVNFADLVLTGVAFRFQAREVNVFANWILQTFGLNGMVAYKFLLVTLVILVCQYIHPTHPKTARGVLIFGSVAYGILMVGVTLSLFLHVFRGW